MAETALEVAIALWRMPSMRAALRERPLPEGVGEVIELAAGNRERVAHAAERLQEPAADVLEAARFYVREVLLAAEGDAYRTLGLAPDAHGADIKAHHRALQHWLHPDRRGDDWDSVFAARINTAWSLLRTPERRASYDALQASAGGAPAGHGGRRLVTGWRAGPDARPAWRRLLLPILALALCLWLLVLASRQATEPPPEWEPAAVAPDAAADTALRRAAPVALGRRTSLAVPDVAPAMPPADIAAPPATDTSAAPIAAPGPTVAAGSGTVAADPRAQAASPPLAQGPVAAEPAGEGVTPTTALAAIAWAPDAGAEPEPVVDEPPPLQRIHLAHAAGQDITGYLRGDAALPPPVWGTVAALDNADALRLRLAAAHDPAMRFGQPQWRIASDRATMTARIHGATGAPQSVRVELAWRNDMWLVEALQAEVRQ